MFPVVFSRCTDSPILLSMGSAVSAYVYFLSLFALSFGECFNWTKLICVLCCVRISGNGSVAEERTVYASAGTGSDSIIPLKTGQRAIGEGADSSMGEHDNRQGDTVKIRRVGRRSGSQEVEKDGCINEAQKDTPYQTEQGQNEQGLHRAGAEFSKQLSAASVQYYDGQARRKTEATQGTQPGHATTPASCNFVWNGNARSNSRSPRGYQLHCSEQSVQPCITQESGYRKVCATILQPTGNLPTCSALNEVVSREHCISICPLLVFLSFYLLFAFMYDLADFHTFYATEACVQR